MSLSAGTRIGPYEIVAALGAGGMGEVYRAHDPRLGRDVALKILPADVASDPARLERFTREARAIAALNHPHIVTIYSTEEADVVRFFTMELVEGQTLDAFIPANGLAVPQFLDLAMPLADALTAAHQKGITHRDLKPANVIVAVDGRVKVLDFGLAKTDAPAGALTDDAGPGFSPANSPTMEATRGPLTHEGMIVGTMPYMSPEQIEGKPLDHRSDLFSLGIMFYEMLAGARPFAGESSAQLMSSILRDAPSLVDARSDLPDPLVRIVSRCLEKRPNDRVQTARDIYNELRHVQRQVESAPARAVDSSSRRAGVDESFGVAVLPFSAAGDAQAATLAEGLTEDITAGVSRFPYLSVVSAHSVRRFRTSDFDVRRVGHELGARYILDGSVRRTGPGVRVSARVTDSAAGTQLWTETYNRDLPSADVLAVQDDLTDRIVGTVADVYGVILRSISQRLRDRSVDGLKPSELLLRYWIYQRQHIPAEHGWLCTALDRLVEQAPSHADAWAAVAHVCCHEHMFGFNMRPNPLARAHRAASRALDLDAVNQHAWEARAIASFFEHDREGFTHAAERAMALNPRNSHTVAWMGGLYTHIGEDDLGCALTERAMALNPHHPGWYYFAFFNRHYRRREFAEALRAAKKTNMPDHLWSHFAVAIAAGQLGREAEATAALDAMVALAPAFADERVLLAAISRWKWDDETIALGEEGFRKAMALRDASGRGVVETPALPTAASSTSSSAGSETAHSREADGTASQRALWIVVLPFTARGTGDEGTWLAEGLTEEITAGLSRFSTLRVMTAPPGKTVASDARTAATELGTRYALEGSVRQAGAQIRVSARLVDVATGAHLWAENYDRDYSSGAFALQDDIARRVIATVGDANGVLVRAMAATLKDVRRDQLSVSDLVLLFHGYQEHLRADEHRRLRDALEDGVRRDPEHADGWACLASLYEHEYSHGFNPLPDSLARARRAAERSIEVNPVCQEGWKAMTSTAFFRRDAAAVQVAGERAVALNPLNTGTVALCGMFLAFAGDWDRGLEIVRQTMAPNPHYPGWLHFAPFLYHYRRCEYAEALQHAKQVNMPMFAKLHMSIAAAAGRLGLRADARQALDALAKVSPQSLDPEVARADWAAWMWTEEDLDNLLEGLRLAKVLAASDVSRAPAATPGRSIAVLPFADLSPGKDQDWFCDGMAEEILTALSQLPGLHVAARASAFSLRDKGDDLSTIAEKLRVATVLQGSVRRAADRVRITVQLVDVANGFQLWSERYDRELKDIFDVQDEIARAVAARLRVTLTDGGQGRVVPQPTTNIEAYELLLKGRVLLMRRGRAILDAQVCFERALALDAGLAEAYALLGDSYRLIALYGLAPATEMMPRARAAVERALAIDGNQVEALAALASITAIYDWDAAESMRIADRALAVDPSHVRTLMERSIVLACLESLPPAVQQRLLHDARRGRELDPLNAWVVAVEGFDLGLTDRAEEAVAMARQAVALDHENFTAWWALTWTLAAGQRYDESLAAAERALSMSGRHPRILTEVAAIHAARGNREGAEMIFQELRRRAQSTYIGWSEQGAAAAAAGRTEEARALVRQGIDGREPFLVFWKLPAWAPFRADPEAMALLRSTTLLQYRTT